MRHGTLCSEMLHEGTTMVMFRFVCYLIHSINVRNRFFSGSVIREF